MLAIKLRQKGQNKSIIKSVLLPWHSCPWWSVYVLSAKCILCLINMYFIRLCDEAILLPYHPPLNKPLQWENQNEESRVTWSSSEEMYMSSSPYERWNPFCNYGQSIYCHSPSLPIGRMRVQGATCWYGNPQPPRTIGQRQPAHDYASNQCLAMLVFFGRWVKPTRWTTEG